MASTNLKTKRHIKYAISYGLAGGSLHSRTFRDAMARAGMQLAPVEEADIVIAHSAGCWLVPQGAKPKLIVYVGMPLATQKPSATWRRALKSGYSNNSFQRNLKISSKNVFYSLSQPTRNLGIIRMAAKSEPIIFKNSKAVFIANRFDPWPSGPRLKKLIDKHGWTFIGLQGSHDNLWDHPDSYVEIIKKYA